MPKPSAKKPINNTDNGENQSQEQKRSIVPHLGRFALLGGGVYSIEYAKNYGDCVVWARPTTRSGAYRYGLTSDYKAAYGIFISLINQ